MTDPIFDLLPTLQEGDHIRVNNRVDALYSRHSTEHGRWLEVVTHEDYLMLALPGESSDAIWSPEVKLESLELVARPELRYPCSPERGDWFYVWYHPDSPPTLYVFWEMLGPRDGSYTIVELHLHDIPKWRKKECRFDTLRGWIHEVEMREDGLYDQDRRIPFFRPPFLPDCLRLPFSQLRLF